ADQQRGEAHASPVREVPHEAVRSLIVADRIAFPTGEAAAVVAAHPRATPPQVQRALRAALRLVPSETRQILGDLREPLVQPGLLGPGAPAQEAALVQVDEVLQLVREGR